MQDYTKLNSAILNQALQPSQAATPASGLIKALTAMLATKGIGRGNALAEQKLKQDKDNRNQAMSSIQGAYRQDKPFEADLFPGEAPIEGLRNKGTGSDINAMVQAMLGSGQADMQNAAITHMLTPKKDDSTGPMKNFQKAKDEGYIGSFIDFMKDTKGGVSVSVGGGFKVPSGHMMNPDFDSTKPPSDTNTPVIPIPGSTQAMNANKKPDAAVAASNYATRMVEAEKTFKVIEDTGYNPANLTDSLAANGGTLGNFFKSPQGRRYYQAASDWVRAKLRKESGAVIGPQEMLDEIATYFPMPGDDAPTIEQKRRARLIATNGMIDQSQGAFKGNPFDIPEIAPVAPVEAPTKTINGKTYQYIDGQWYETGN